MDAQHRRRPRDSDADSSVVTSSNVKNLLEQLLLQFQRQADEAGDSCPSQKQRCQRSSENRVSVTYPTNGLTSASAATSDRDKVDALPPTATSDDRNQPVTGRRLHKQASFQAQEVAASLLVVGGQGSSLNERRSGGLAAAAAAAGAGTSNGMSRSLTVGAAESSSPHVQQITSRSGWLTRLKFVSMKCSIG